jgi:Fe-S cluster assembly protein SufD
MMNLALAKNRNRTRAERWRSPSRATGCRRGQGCRCARQAFDAYQRAGLPHRRIEDWKYTDLRVLMREVLPLAAAPDAAALTRAGAALKLHAIEGVRRLVLVDGTFAPGLSRMADPEKGSASARCARCWKPATAAPAGNCSHPINVRCHGGAQQRDDDGRLVIEVADGVAHEAPAHRPYRQRAVPRRCSPARCCASASAAGATLVESYIAAGDASGYQVHDALTLSIGDRARLDHVRLIEDSREAFNISSALVSLGARAHFNTFGMTSGANVSRYQAVIAVAGEGARVETNGVNLLNGRQHADTTLFLDHAVPNCSSREIFRAVVDDRGHSVFQGRIIVRPKAQKTDAKMMTRALLLSDEAEADNKPELEIFADDVTCGHGATTGALDESLLFYLRARGLPRRRPRRC